MACAASIPEANELNTAASSPVRETSRNSPVGSRNFEKPGLLRATPRSYRPSMAPASTVPEASVDPFAAAESLRAALDAAGIVLPSLAVDPQPSTVRLIDLGRI